MAADSAMHVRGVITHVYRGDWYAVAIDLNGHQHTALCRRAGRLVLYQVRCILGDEVECELSAFDTRRGRIVYRGRRQEAG